MNKYNYGDEKGDNWFKHKGVTPPERHTHLTEDELHQALEDHISKHSCTWRQEGAEIICDQNSDGIVHGKRIGPNLKLAVDKDGNVITDIKGVPRLVPMGPVLRINVSK